MFQSTEKSLLYISEAAEPRKPGSTEVSEFPRIFFKARNFNRRQGISGGIGFEDGYFIQVLEGPAAPVNELFERICRDPRHKNLSVLIDAPIASRHFDEERMLILNRDTREKFAAYCGIHLPDTTNLDDKAVQLMTFMGWRETLRADPPANPGQADIEIENCLFAISEWPDFDEIISEPEIVEACAMLLSRYHSASDIAAMAFAGDLDAASRLLQRLDAQNILRRKRTAVSQSPASGPSRYQSFYQKVRSFLKVGSVD